MFRVEGEIVSIFKSKYFNATGHTERHCMEFSFGLAFGKYKIRRA